MFKSQASFNNSFFGNYAYQRIIERHKEHLLVRLDKTVDLSFIEDLVRDCYCPDNGRDAYNPVIMFKILFLQNLYNLSDRKIAEECDTNILFRYFIGLSLEEAAPNFTLLGKFKERLGEEKFTEIFNRIILLAKKEGLINNKLRLIDCTKIVAKVNISKCKKEKNDDNDYIDRNSPDSEASIGHKSADNTWYGYKSGILLAVDSEIVTALETTTASVHDIHHLERLVEKDLNITGGFNRLAGDKAFIGKEDFLKEKKIVDNTIRKNNMKIPRRKSYLSDKAVRPVIEHKFAEGKNLHGLGKAKYWGRLKIHIQSLLIYLTMNLKKITNILNPAIN